MATSAGKVLFVNVGAVRDFEYGGRPAKSAIWKAPVVGRIAARGVNLAGDDQADRDCPIQGKNQTGIAPAGKVDRRMSRPTHRAELNLASINSNT